MMIILLNLAKKFANFNQLNSGNTRGVVYCCNLQVGPGMLGHFTLEVNVYIYLPIIVSI